MKTGVLLATAITITLVTASHHSLASTLPAADTGSVVEAIELPVCEFAPGKWTKFANRQQVKITGEASGSMGALHVASTNPGKVSVLPEFETVVPGIIQGMPGQVPPVNPPLDTPAFYNGLVNAPTMMPAVVPSHTLPGSGFGQVVVPVPAAVWLFGSGLLALLGVARQRQQ